MRSSKDLQLPPDTNVPNHIAIIPDGNRRWARARGLHTLKGHKRGFERAVEIGRVARKWGIHTATLWGFSTENWDRTEEEVNYLMKLYEKLIGDYLKDAHKEKIKIRHIGRKDRLPSFLLKKIEKAEVETMSYNKFVMNIGLDYGGQDDILRAIKKIINDGVDAKDIDAKLFEKYVDNHDQTYPYVDLMIRTSGEQRTSGFLLWQSAYTEYYWENDHFPDFTPLKLREAILDYSRRRRRFGGNDNVEHFKFKPEFVAGLELKWWRLKNIPEGTGFADYTFQHIKEQFGLSKDLSITAAKYLVTAILSGDKNDWKKATKNAYQFYKLIKDEVKLAFEPSLAATLQVKLWKELSDKNIDKNNSEVEETAKNLYAEVYRISIFQATKLAHLRILANRERNLAEQGKGDHHWDNAEDYLEKFYSALKERVA